MQRKSLRLTVRQKLHETPVMLALCLLPELLRQKQPEPPVTITLFFSPCRNSKGFSVPGRENGYCLDAHQTPIFNDITLFS